MGSIAGKDAHSLNLFAAFPFFLVSLLAFFIALPVGLLVERASGTEVVKVEKPIAVPSQCRPETRIFWAAWGTAQIHFDRRKGYD